MIDREPGLAGLFVRLRQIVVRDGVMWIDLERPPEAHLPLAGLPGRFLRQPEGASVHTDVMRLLIAESEGLPGASYALRGW